MNLKKFKIGILTDYLLHPENDDFLAVAENQELLKLIHFLRDDLEYTVDVFQVSAIPERSFRGFKVFGIDTTQDQLGMFTGLNTVFAQRGLAYDLKIYFHWNLANPMICNRSIVVSHGVFWDSPASLVNRMNELSREEWEKRCLYAVAAPEAFVVEDRNTANVINALWAGYSHRLVYIPPGIDLDRFKPLPKDCCGEKIRVVCPQDFTVEQGIQEILKLCGIFAARKPWVEFKIVGQTRNFEDALCLADQVRSFNNCRFEWVPLARMPEIYQNADIALLPSRASEGASLYCLQALASGLPVIAGLTGGLSEMVIDGWNGRLIHPHLNVLIETLWELVQDRGLRLKMGQNARKLAEGYSESNWKKRWQTLIERVLRNKTGVISGCY